MKFLQSDTTRFSGKTYWLIGASEGLGRAMAEEMAAAGARLILSARSAPELEALAARLPGAQSLVLDVTDPRSMDNAASRLDRIDGMVYIAGTYTPMRAQQWDTDKVMQMFDVNLGGAVRALGLVLPEMNARNSGHIVLIGSLAGYQGLPGAIGYGASKAALMHLGQNLYCDLQDTDIRVQVINPGYIETRLTEQNRFAMPQIMSPEEAARRTLRIMQGRRFMAAYPAPFKWLFTLGRFVPYTLYARLFG